MKHRIPLLLGLIGLLTILLLGCSLGGGNVAGITPTPTKTQRPLFTSTVTPTATSLSTEPPTSEAIPTDTPIPPTEAVPTDAPAPTEPLLPSDTPVSPTVVPPTNTPIPPTSTPPPPANTPKPQPTNTPVPPTNTPKPQIDFRVVQQDLVPKAENVAQLYTIYVRVEDMAGNPLNGLIVWDPGQPAMQALSGDKSGYYHAEVLMGGGEYYLEVKDARSEKTKRLTTVRTGLSNEDLIKAGYCVDAADCDTNVGPQHFSWRVIFRRTW